MKRIQYSHEKYLQTGKKQITDYEPNTIFADLLTNKKKFIQWVDQNIEQLKDEKKAESSEKFPTSYLDSVDFRKMNHQLTLLINQAYLEVLHFCNTHIGYESSPTHIDDFYENYEKECRDKLKEYVNLYISKMSSQRSDTIIRDIKDGDIAQEKLLMNKISALAELIRNYSQKLENIQSLWNILQQASYSNMDSFDSYRCILTELETEFLQFKINLQKINHYSLADLLSTIKNPGKMATLSVSKCEKDSRELLHNFLETLRVYRIFLSGANPILNLSAGPHFWDSAKYPTVSLPLPLTCESLKK